MVALASSKNLAVESSHPETAEVSAAKEKIQAEEIVAIVKESLQSAQSVTEGSVGFATEIDEFKKIEKELAAVEVTNNLTEKTERSSMSNAFEKDGIWAYGIDTLDKENPSSKDRVFMTLESLDRPNSDGQDKNAQIKQSFDEVLTATNGEQVHQGDLVATYDALTLRISNLKEKNVDTVSQKAFQRKKDILETYLREHDESIDLSQNGSNARLASLSNSSKKYHRGSKPSQVSPNFNKLSRRAAIIEVYAGPQATADLESIKAKLAAYPEEPTAFRHINIRESLHGISPKMEKTASAVSVESVLKRDTENEVEELDQAELIAKEIENAKEQVAKLGVTHPLLTFLLGSAARNELRTRTTDEENPSDIDLLMIVSEPDIQLLSDKMQEPEVRLSRSRTASGATFFLVKCPSISGEVVDTEVMICSRESFEKQLNGDEKEAQTRFVNDAVKEGIIVNYHGLKSVASETARGILFL